MKKSDVKKMFKVIEYPKDKIGNVSFAIVSKEKDVQMKNALILNGDTDATVDQIYADYSNEYKIIFKPFEIHYSVLESIKANRETSIDLITSTYVNTKNEEYKNYINSGKYLESSNFNNSITQ